MSSVHCVGGEVGGSGGCQLTADWMVLEDGVLDDKGGLVIVPEGGDRDVGRVPPLRGH